MYTAKMSMLFTNLLILVGMTFSLRLSSHHNLGKSIMASNLCDKSKKVAKVGVGSLGVVMLQPNVALAVPSIKAAEALQLLDGYQTRTPYSVTWTVLLVGATWIIFELYKQMANW